MIVVLQSESSASLPYSAISATPGGRPGDVHKVVWGASKLGYGTRLFRAGCGTVDAIHAARLLLEKHREKQKPVHFAFLDLEKALDRVPREVIWGAPGICAVPAALRDRDGCDLTRSPDGTLLYADDVTLACENKTELERQAQSWCDRLALFGLKLNVKKTEYLTTDCNGNENATVDGRSSAFGNKNVRNDAIRQRFGVAPIAEKLREARLRWYGHVLRANDDIVRKIGLNLEVPGKRPRGRPKQRTLARYVAFGLKDGWCAP
ncbi:unnamed protein product [Heligmosomoides polygyrus]|uniref:Reverse transcriptase domain-containing protein n=1 Tax=Heligmosomoides polygyrus TaxID=6339 RepID=A0A183GML6_HELPZ|nr:unnamed protein product [Heligmosomoides polygyrus]